jgi:NAD(P)-dependent dehydrogenase (short-subunit alcohol dehydrogenase family)
MTSIVVTGTNAGMGLGFVKELLKYPEVTHIFATARDPTSSASAELRKVADESSGRIHLIPLELTEKSAAVSPRIPAEGGFEEALIEGCGGGGEESVGG